MAYGHTEWDLCLQRAVKLGAPALLPHRLQGTDCSPHTAAPVSEQRKAFPTPVSQVWSRSDNAWAGLELTGGRDPSSAVTPCPPSPGHSQEGHPHTMGYSPSPARCFPQVWPSHHFQPSYGAQSPIPPCVDARDPQPQPWQLQSSQPCTERSPELLWQPAHTGRV